MNDEDVAALLRSDEPLILIEAPAGCGKTHQGADYAKHIASEIGTGRLLILTHTHAAKGVFSGRTSIARTKVEINTIDALIAQIAAAYYKVLELPPDPASWARQQSDSGFSELALKVSTLLSSNPMIAAALAERYPIIICDEHQDSSLDQHNIVFSLYQSGAKLRIFGDPMQRIFGKRSDEAIATDRKRWEQLKKQGAYGQLETPHRWQYGSPELGYWILEARKLLLNRKPIKLNADLPKGLAVLVAENVAQNPRGYQLNGSQRKPVDKILGENSELLILAATNKTVRELRSCFNRRIPIWEGHTRDALNDLVDVLSKNQGNPVTIGNALVDFLNNIAVGFTLSSHGKRLEKEIEDGCKAKTTGKPALIQEIAQCILNKPNHIGVSNAISKLLNLVDTKTPGFDTIKIDYKSELYDAIRLSQFEDPVMGFSEITRRRSYANPSPPHRTLSTVHKAKGLECDHAMIMACDNKHFSSSDHSRCKFYVALSRAKRSLTLVVPQNGTSPLLEINTTR